MIWSASGGRLVPAHVSPSGWNSAFLLVIAVEDVWRTLMNGGVKRILVLAAIALAGLIVQPPLAAAGPPSHMVRLGILGTFAPSFDPTDPTDPATREFFDGLRALGYTPGRDIVFEYKAAQGNAEALPQLAEELVQSRVDILLTPNTSTTLAAAKSHEDRPDRHGRRH